MPVTKTNFINYSRCSRYVPLSEIKKDRLEADITYKQYKDEELADKISELLFSMYEIDEEGEEKDLIDVEDPQLKVMLPFYNRVELETGRIVDQVFGGKSTYAESTFSQESFGFTENAIKYLCYVDIYNESDGNINIIEVKATTSNKYLEGLKTGFRSSKNKKFDKFPIFYSDKKGIYHLKEELDNWNIKEEMPEENYIKNKNKLKDRYSDVGKYVYDLAVQRYFIEKDFKQTNREDFLPKVKYYLAVLNHDYVFDGTYVDKKAVYNKDENGNEIVRIFDLTKLTEEMQQMVNDDKNRVESYILNPDARECAIGKHCQHKAPSKCKFCKICFDKIPKYNSSLSYMNNGQGFKDEDGCVHKGLDLINEGYIDMLDVPENWIKNPNHTIQRNCLHFHTQYINKEKIKLAINNLNYPIYHLDFETFPCPFPRFKGEKCYTQSPFQFSLHIEREPGVCDKEKDNFSFLATKFDEDVREDLVKALVKYIDPSKGTLFAQNVSFEKSRILELSKIFPEYKEQLVKMTEIASDLLYIVRNNSSFYERMGYDKEEASIVNFYDEHLSGSYSIKKTLPVFSNLKYSDLDVQNGTQALVTYAMFPTLTKEEYDFKYNALLEYCKQDTWAMVEILWKLKEISK